jgi:hypothetical protein
MSLSPLVRPNDCGPRKQEEVVERSFQYVPPPKIAVYTRRQPVSAWADDLDDEKRSRRFDPRRFGADMVCSSHFHNPRGNSFFIFKYFLWVS